MARVALPEGASAHCFVDDFLWPWDHSTPVLMMHGFARNAMFWNCWVPAIAETYRVYRPDLPGCGVSDQPPDGYRYTRRQSGHRSWRAAICVSNEDTPGSYRAGKDNLLRG